MKTHAVLPKDEADRLRQLREDKNYEELYLRTLALREAKWPLRAIADELGVSRMAVKNWEDSAKKRNLADKLSTVTVPELPLDAVGSEGRPVRKPIDVPTDERETLRILAQSAKKVRRWTPLNAQERQDAAKLDELLVKHFEARGVQPMIIARHAGVTRRAVVARLERYHARSAS